MELNDLFAVKNMNWISIASLLLLLAGVLFYIYWGVTYGVWADIGIYSITLIFVLFGIFGLLVSLLESKKDEEER
jgi:hypothetical protein